jgi:hypothetical protein
MCMFCRSLFVLLHFFFWPLRCLFFFDIRFLITSLVSSNSSEGPTNDHATVWVSSVLHFFSWGEGIFIMQKDKQRSTKHTHKTKDRVTQTPLKTGGELMCSGRVNCSCSTSGTHRVNLVTSTVISHERGKDREVHTTNETYRGHLWHYDIPELLVPIRISLIEGCC